MTESTTELTVLTTEIIAAYVENNRVEVDALPNLIRAVYGALNGLGVDVVEVEVEQPKPTALQVRKSITDAGLVSFIDGKTYQTLKRHIGRHDMTPDDYRARYGLSADYPIVAPAYAARRSELAKAIGLGTKPRQATKSRKKA
ncbi:MucR family transcriptional regulator [Brevundimonas sp. G8]|uniref:MucR family transcriptional regulator n=1 Tax=Brevundimonas sp. G8 TaxID=1350776 RepID=UPI0012F1C716|nr:MucR family transcriptional regulator [Brevundimonas sp. G8]VXB41441.1 Transcriptional regulatory protein MucR [Brevundimonas sp. G8]